MIMDLPPQWVRRTKNDKARNSQPTLESLDKLKFGWLLYSKRFQHAVCGLVWTFRLDSLPEVEDNKVDGMISMPLSVATVESLYNSWHSMGVFVVCLSIDLSKHSIIRLLSKMILAMQQHVNRWICVMMAWRSDSVWKAPKLPKRGGAQTSSYWNQLMYERARKVYTRCTPLYIIFIYEEST